MFEESPMRPGLRILAAAASLFILASCSDAPTVPQESSVFICQVSQSGGQVTEVPSHELAAHLSQGDYVARFFVTGEALVPNDSVHFSRITEAVDAARAIRVANNEMTSGACRITIAVAPGAYTGSLVANPGLAFERFPIVLDVPDITLAGAFKMQIDAAGRATGTGTGGPPTILLPNVPLLEQAQGLDDPMIVVNGHPGGFQGNGIVIDGFVFVSGHPDGDPVKGGFGILSIRVQDLVIRGNLFQPGLTSGIDLRASSASVEHNFISGGAACDMCLAGPGNYTATGNRILAGGIDGILIQPVVQFPLPPGLEAYSLPSSASVTAAIVNNDIRDHLQKPAGVGVRLATIGFGAQNVPTSAKLDVRDNQLINNFFGMQVEAGFPLANTVLRGDADVTLKGNTISKSCQKDLLVVFTRHSTALGAGQLTRPYVRNSTYNLVLGGDVKWEDVWYSDPAGFGNTLTVDGVTMANGARLAYDPAKVCLPLG
jgi:hypothetical protein